MIDFQMQFCYNFSTYQYLIPNLTYLSSSVLETDKGSVPVLILFPVESSPSEYDPPSPSNKGSIEPSLVLLLARRDVDPLPEWVDPRIPEAKEWGTLFLRCRLLMEMCSDMALLAYNKEMLYCFIAVTRNNAKANFEWRFNQRKHVHETRIAKLY